MEPMASGLPGWLRLTWAVLLGAVVIVHIGHAIGVNGQHRWWHVGHTLMAAGMALMYLLPRMAHPGLYEAGLVAFLLLAVAMAAVVALVWRREDVLNPLWVAAAVDLMAMTYMFVPTTSRPAQVTFLLMLYLGSQAVAWLMGLWNRVPNLSPEPFRVSDAASANVGEVDSVQRPERAVGLQATASLSVRSTLAVMAASMAYMLAVM